MKIVVLDGYTLNPGDLTWDRLKDLGDVKIYDRTPLDKIVERIGDAEYVFTNKTVLTRETFEICENIKYVGVLATGYNVVDIVAAKDNNIVVTNIPIYGTKAVSQFVFALLLGLCHRVEEHSEDVKKGKWTNNIDFCFWNNPLIELDGKVMGIIGFGRIGQSTAKLAEAFGLKVLVHTTNPQKELETTNIKFVELDELYAKSDIISLHCPLFPSTEGMINKISIGKMKDGVKIINTSRGPLIVEQDLADALKSGKVSGAGIDVLSSEPPQKNNPLLKANNCIITPHIAWAPKESRERLMNTAVDNLKAFINGKHVNVVNK